MHYGTAFAQREANYADDGVWGKGGGEGEIEDTAASNIQALVELLYIYLRSGFALYSIPHLDCVTMRSHLFFQMFLSSSSRPHSLPHDQTQTHPTWTSHSIADHPVTGESAERLLHLSQWNAGIRLKPARTPVPRLSVEGLRAFQRSHRSVPSKFSQFLLFLWAEYDVTPHQQETPSGQTVGSKASAGKWLRAVSLPNAERRLIIYSVLQNINILFVRLYKKLFRSHTGHVLL